MDLMCLTLQIYTCSPKQVTNICSRKVLIVLESNFIPSPVHQVKNRRQNPLDGAKTEDNVPTKSTTMESSDRRAHLCGQAFAAYSGTRTQPKTFGSYPWEGWEKILCDSNKVRFHTPMSVLVHGTPIFRMCKICLKSSNREIVVTMFK